MRSGLLGLVLWAAVTGLGCRDEALTPAPVEARLALADEARVELAGRGAAEVGVAADAGKESNGRPIDLNERDE